MTHPDRSSLLARLGMRLPVIQAPIGSATSPELAAAVSNAGGLGMLAMSWRDAAQIRDTIRRTRDLTDRPFGANLVLAWDQAERLEVVLHEGVRIVSLFWGDPTDLTAVVHAAGGFVLHTVGSVAEARAAAAAGIDAIVAQGWEAGGHVRGQTATMALVPAVKDAVAPLPVVAAGGIADGRGLAAALMLGADAVWVGTRFLASLEAAVAPAYRDAVLTGAGDETLHTGLFDVGWPDAPHRVLRNSTVARWEAAGCPPAGRRPGEGEVIATDPAGRPVMRYGDAIPAAEASGDLEALALYCGQGVGLVTRAEPAATILATMVDEARVALRTAAAGAW